MRYIIDTQSSTDEKVIANVISLSKFSGVISSVSRIDIPSTDTTTSDVDESLLMDSDILISEMLDKDSYLASYPIRQGLYIDTLSINVITKYSEGTKLCIYTTGGLFKSFDIGNKTGVINFNLMDGENIPEDETVTKFETSSNFVAIKIDGVFKPVFYNFGDITTPTNLYFKIVGNENTSGSALLTGKLGAL